MFEFDVCVKSGICYCLSIKKIDGQAGGRVVGCQLEMQDIKR
jgi:hypothetical protein